MLSIQILNHFRSLLLIVPTLSPTVPLPCLPALGKAGRYSQPEAGWRDLARPWTHPLHELLVT